MKIRSIYTLVADMITRVRLAGVLSSDKDSDPVANGEYWYQYCES